MTNKPNVQGEGDYDAARRYNESTRDHAHSGKVDEAAEAAKPRTPGEAAELERAEEAGRARAKEEDPNLNRGQKPRD